MSLVRLTVPELTHDREVLHLGLAVLVAAEYASLHGPGVFGSPLHASLAGVGWALVVSLLGASESHQAHAVETLAVYVAAVAGSLVGAPVAGVGTHYWALAHPLGSALTAVVRVFSLVVPAFVGSVVWGELAAWWRLRGTTPEERVLEGDG